MKLVNRNVMLAGWLFADCMLGLMIVGLASDPGRPASARVTPTPTPSATVSATVTPEPSPRPTPSPRASAVRAPGVAQTANTEEFRLRGRSDAEVVAAMRKRYQALISGGRRAAFVLTFGTASTPGPGVQAAKRANKLLGRAAPQVFSGSARRSYWQSQNGESPTSGVVRVEVYLFNAQ